MSAQSLHSESIQTLREKANNIKDVELCMLVIPSSRLALFILVTIAFLVYIYLQCNTLACA